MAEINYAEEIISFKTVLEAIIFGGAVLSLMLAVFYFSIALENTNKNKKWIAVALGPASFFIPNFWNQEGKRARLKFLIYFGFFVFLVC